MKVSKLWERLKKKKKTKTPRENTPVFDISAKHNRHGSPAVHIRGRSLLKLLTFLTYSLIDMLRCNTDLLHSARDTNSKTTEVTE